MCIMTLEIITYFEIKKRKKKIKCKDNYINTTIL